MTRIYTREDFPHFDAAMEAVRGERIRQLRLKHEGRFTYTPADEGISWSQRLAMLTEEMGEVAREVLALHGLVQEKSSYDRLRTELVQLAAVAVACVEATTPYTVDIDWIGTRADPRMYTCDHCDWTGHTYSEWLIHANAHGRRMTSADNRP